MRNDKPIDSTSRESQTMDNIPTQDTVSEEDPGTLLERSIMLMEARQKLTTIGDTFALTMRDNVDAQKSAISNIK